MKIFLDSADLNHIPPEVDGLTTNPSLMRASKVTDYKDFAQAAIRVMGKRPVSLEVLADDDDGIVRQGKLLASWGSNVWVKVPWFKTTGFPNGQVIRELCQSGVQVNVTALLSDWHAEAALLVIPENSPAILSFFAGRCDDIGLDSDWTVSGIVRRAAYRHPYVQVLWASVREVSAIRRAERAGCSIVTVPLAILDRLPLSGKGADAYAMETTRQFARDAEGYVL